MEMGIASSLTLLAMTDRRFLQPEQCRERYGDTLKNIGVRRDKMVAPDTCVVLVPYIHCRFSMDVLS
jgi:hypothetical protein